MNSLIYKRLLQTLNLYIKSKIAKKIQVRELKFFNINKPYFNEHHFYTSTLSSLSVKNKIANFLSSYSLLKHGEQNKDGSHSDEYSFNDSSNAWFKLLSLPLGIFIAKYFEENANSNKFYCEEKDKNGKSSSANNNENDTIPPIKRPNLGCSIRKKDDGMQVIMIKTGSPAELAGIKITDIILKINDHEIKSIEDYYFAIGIEKGQKKIKLKRHVTSTNANSEVKHEFKIFEVNAFFD